MRWPRTLAGGALAATLLVIGQGCGARQKPVPTEGVVTLDGKPVAGVIVTFNPVGEGKAASGTTEADGAFRLTTFRTHDGALPGDYKITITKSKAIDPEDVNKSDPEQMKAFVMKAMKAASQRQAKPAKKTEGPELPREYGDASRTTLRARVPHDGPVRLDLRKTGSS